MGIDGWYLIPENCKRAWPSDSPLPVISEDREKLSDYLLERYGSLIEKSTDMHTYMYRRVVEERGKLKVIDTRVTFN